MIRPLTLDGAIANGIRNLQRVRIRYEMRGTKYWWTRRKTNTPIGTAFVMGNLFRYCQSDTTQRGESAERDSDSRFRAAKKLRICSGQSSSSR